MERWSTTADSETSGQQPGQSRGDRGHLISNQGKHWAGGRHVTNTASHGAMGTLPPLCPGVVKREVSMRGQLLGHVLIFVLFQTRVV